MLRRLRLWYYRRTDPVWHQDNPCHRLFIDCEGDCDECPNKAYFAQVDEEALYDFDGDIVDGHRMEW